MDFIFLNTENNSYIPAKRTKIKKNVKKYPPFTTKKIDKGNIINDANPNGSSNNIAGILNNKKNVLGMMPHPERLIDPILSGEDGSLMFESLFNSLI